MRFGVGLSVLRVAGGSRTLVSTLANGFWIATLAALLPVQRTPTSLLTSFLQGSTRTAKPNHPDLKLVPSSVRALSGRTLEIQCPEDSIPGVPIRSAASRQATTMGRPLPVLNVAESPTALGTIGPWGLVSAVATSGSPSPFLLLVGISLWR